MGQFFYNFCSSHRSFCNLFLCLILFVYSNPVTFPLSLQMIGFMQKPVNHLVYFRVEPVIVSIDADRSNNLVNSSLSTFTANG